MNKFATPPKPPARAHSLRGILDCLREQSRPLRRFLLRNPWLRTQRQLLRENWRIWKTSRQYRNDSLYDLGMVDQFFIDRSTPEVNDTAILERIVVAYNKAKRAQQNTGPAYRPSNEWLPIYEGCLCNVMDALSKGDIPRLRGIYQNFFRDPCSVGLHGAPVDMAKCYFGNHISRKWKMYLLNGLVPTYRQWQNRVGKVCNVSQLVSPSIGNPYGCYIDGQFLYEPFIAHYYATQIGQLTRGKKRAVLELGGGYGRMAYFLMRDNTNLTYLDFDLPENMALTSYYLLSAFPNKRFLLFGESELAREPLDQYAAIIMPSFALTQLPDRSADLAFNSYSLAEMSREAVDTYIAELMRVTDRYILHLNHTRVSQVVADNFGIDPAKFDLLYRVPGFWTSGINPNVDEYEFLYKRIEM